MWNRTKRLINSYLDHMIEKASSPDRDVRAMTRAEITRLNEVEIQASTAAKVLEKELAEVNLKLLGLAERERIMREQGNENSALRAHEAILSLSAQRDLLQQQIHEASASVVKARSLREKRKIQGEDLASETILTQMRENVAGVHTGFDPLDPSSTIDEMRSRLNLSPSTSLDAKVAEAEMEMEEQQKKSRVDDLLTQYKNQLDQQPDAHRAVSPPDPATSNLTEKTTEKKEEGDSPQAKSLGRSEGNIRPID
jgi:hypothetical protein